MSTASTRKPQNPGSNGPGRNDREPPAAAGGESHALHNLVRLIGRQAAREFIRRQQSDGSLIDLPVEDTR